jgi:hypothetical protein
MPLRHAGRAVMARLGDGELKPSGTRLIITPIAKSMPDYCEVDEALTRKNRAHTIERMRLSLRFYRCPSARAKGINLVLEGDDSPGTGFVPSQELRLRHT